MDTVGRKFRVDWLDVGDGRFGDYDPNNPEDVALLSFSLSEKKGEDWKPLINLLTGLPVATPEAIRKKGTEMILARIGQVAKKHAGTEKILEAAQAMSFIELSWFEEDSDAVF